MSKENINLQEVELAHNNGLSFKIDHLKMIYKGLDSIENRIKDIDYNDISDEYLIYISFIISKIENEISDIVIKYNMQSSSNYDTTVYNLAAIYKAMDMFKSGLFANADNYELFSMAANSVCQGNLLDIMYYHASKIQYKLQYNLISLISKNDPLIVQSANQLFSEIKTSGKKIELDISENGIEISNIEDYNLEGLLYRFNTIKDDIIKQVHNLSNSYVSEIISDVDGNITLNGDYNASSG